MTWETLNNATDRYLEKKRLERIAQIVAAHPKWLTEEPELQELLQEAGLIPQLDQTA